jgi:hypothetical protein
MSYRLFSGEKVNDLFVAVFNDLFPCLAGSGLRLYGVFNDLYVQVAENKRWDTFIDYFARDALAFGSSRLSSS